LFSSNLIAVFFMLFPLFHHSALLFLYQQKGFSQAKWRG